MVGNEKRLLILVGTIDSQLIRPLYSSLWMVHLEHGNCVRAAHKLA